LGHWCVLWRFVNCSYQLLASKSPVILATNSNTVRNHIMILQHNDSASFLSTFQIT
jgi:hypothetical protein